MCRFVAAVMKDLRFACKHLTSQIVEADNQLVLSIWQCGPPLLISERLVTLLVPQNRLSQKLSLFGCLFVWLVGSVRQW
eukprot:gene8637-6067_t